MINPVETMLLAGVFALLADNSLIFRRWYMWAFWNVAAFIAGAYTLWMVLR